jgi:hypothetical protein
VRLSVVCIAGYRSIRDPIKVHIEPRTTVVLGANDHGKTNLLSAIQHLNPDHRFNADWDLNWDCEDESDSLPFVSFEFQLADQDRADLLVVANKARDLTRVREYGQRLSELAEDARNSFLAEHAAADEAAARVAELEQELESHPEGSEERREHETRVAAASADADSKRSLAANASEVSATAAHRVALAHAEELKVEAGEPELDLKSHVSEVESGLSRAETVARRASSKLETAQQASEAVDASDEAATRKAQRSLDAAERDADDAIQRRDTLSRRAETLKGATAAMEMAAAGELSFSHDLPLPPASHLSLDDIPSKLVLAREGIEGSIAVQESPPLELDELVLAFVMSRVPRVELISPQEALADEVDVETILDPENDFMRGIFRYADLGEKEWAGIFDQNDRTVKRLDAASDRLNETLRASWSQGKELEFKLRHNSGRVDLRLQDPAVSGRYVRASRRSSGFTHFFALRTVLYARQEASGAASFIWLFDEPGIYLHPEGQQDLLQVLETLSEVSQIVYATHSLFLINKNFPTRHRLLTKRTTGTSVDEKPFSGRWRATLDALGLGLPGTILFASRVVLTEGDSEPILLNADLQRLIQLGEFDSDLNSMAIIGTGDAKHTDALIRILSESAAKPRIVLLFDGDKGGADRRKSVRRVAERYRCEIIDLTKDTTGEDHVLSPTLYREATIKYVEWLANERQSADDEGVPADVRASLEESYKKEFDGTSAPKGLGRWARDAGKELLGGSESPSPVGIAREYVALIAAEDESQLMGKKRALALAKSLRVALDLPTQTLDMERILEE